MASVTVRPALADDLPDLQRIYRDASLSNAGDRDALLAHPDALTFSGASIADGRTIVACVDKLVAGFATTLEAGGIVELEDLFVDPEFMRQGLGGTLIDEIVQRLEANGMDHLEVTANPHAAAFYESCGFEPIGSVATEFGPGTRMRR